MHHDRIELANLWLALRLAVHAGDTVLAQRALERMERSNISIAPRVDYDADRRAQTFDR